MKKYLSLILVVAIVISGIYIYPAAATTENTYKESYGIQLGQPDDSLSAAIYAQMVQNYICQDNEDTNLAAQLENGGKIILEPESLTLKGIYENQEVFKTYASDWFQNQRTTISDAVRDAFDAFIKDYPQAYWLKSMNMEEELIASITSVENGVEGEAKIKVTLQPDEYEEEISGYISSFNNAVCQAKNDITSRYNITSDTKTEDIVKYIHDFIASKVDYNFDVVNHPENEGYNYAHTPLSVFISSEIWGDKVVCEGYAKAFKILCDQFGVENAILIGDSVNPQGGVESHMWNAVKVAEQWYAVDVAWDDQGENTYDVYLLVGKNSKGLFDIYKNDHIAVNQFSSYETSKKFILPEIAERGFWQQDESTQAVTGENITDSDETTTAEGITNPDETATKETVTGEKESSTPPQESVTDARETTKGASERETTAKPEEYSTSITTVTYYWRLTGLKNAVYTGKQIKQKLQFSCDGKKLKEGTDYKISYKNNINAGKASVIITPIGKYKNVKPSSYTYNFTITKASIKKATAKKVKVQKYKKGKAVKPAVKLSFNGKNLKKGKDYKVTYKNNKKKGTATIVIKGKGNFKGTKKIKFKIK